MASNFQQIVLLENGNYSLSTNIEETILYHQHLSIHPFSDEETKEWSDLLNSKKFLSYLIEVKEGRLLPSEDKVWLENLDLSILNRAGISRIAYVSPQNIFNSLEMEKILINGAVIKIKIFRNANDAVQWLEQHPNLTDQKQE